MTRVYCWEENVCVFGREGEVLDAETNDLRKPSLKTDSCIYNRGRRNGAVWKTQLGPAQP